MPTKKRKTTKSARPTPKPPPTIARSPKGPVDADEVSLVPQSGQKKDQNTKKEAWGIFVGGKRAGRVFINYINEPPIGSHASLQIFLNRSSQGRHIGRIAYRMACEASKYDIVYAHMSKSNIASRRAAEEAGFENVTPPNYSQLILKRIRHV